VAGRWLRLVAAAFREGGGSRVGAALVGPDGKPLRTWGGPAREGDDAQAAVMRAVLQGMWAARSAGRALRVCVHPPEVAGWLARRTNVPDRYVPWFVQIRALSHSYRRVEFLPASPAEVELARRAAEGSDGPAAVQELEPVAR